MQTDTNVHRFISGYFTVDNYKLAYKEAIFPIADDDKSSDGNRELRLRPPVTRRQPGWPRRKRIESQAFDVRELHCAAAMDPVTIDDLAMKLSSTRHCK